jgi:hypothetical protein
MKHKPFIQITVGLALALGYASSADAQAAKKIDLKVLYAGEEEKHPRTQDYMNFLKQHFTTVGYAPYTEFKPEMADAYQVVVFDAFADQTRGGIGLPRAPELPQDFNRASVLVAGAGVNVARKMNLKFDWL